MKPSLKINWRMVGVAVGIVALVILLSVIPYPSNWVWLRDVLVVAGLAFVGVATVLAILPLFLKSNSPSAGNVPTKTVHGDEVHEDSVTGDKVAGAKNTLTVEPHADVKQAAVGTVTQNYYDNRVMPAPGSALPNPLFSIPPPPPDFTGRADELDTLLANIERQGGAAISGLVGFGGVGKTALALKVAERLKANYPDAHISIDLQGTKKQLEPVQAMQQVVRAFVPATEKLPETPNEMTALYRTVLHDKRALVLFDDAHDAAQIRPLLPLPGCAVLVTSRKYFVVPGLTPLRLDVLNDRDARDLLLKICPRIADRSGEIATLCGRIPLALQIAASFLAERIDLTPQDYIERLRARRLTTLKAEDDAELDVEQVFAESYDQLSAEMQNRWRTLGVFPASFTAEAALAVWHESKPENGKNTLNELVRYSLVEFRADRYELHDLLRDYALAKQSPDEKWQAQKRHAGFYLRIGYLIDKLYLEGGSKIINGLTFFDLELTNIRAGREWAAANAQTNIDAALLSVRYPDAVKYVMPLRLAVHERIIWLTDGVNAARQTGHREAEGAWLVSLAIVYADLGEAHRTIEYCEQALVITQDIGDRHNTEIALGNLGSAYAALGEVRRAIEFYERAIAIAREIGDKRNEGNWLDNLGIAYAHLGEVRRAIEFHVQALAIDRDIRDPRGEGNALGNLGAAYYRLGEVHRAVEYYEQALAIHHEIGDRRAKGSILGNLGLAYAKSGEIHRAIEYYEQALGIALEVADRRGEGNVLGNLGTAYAALNETRRSIEFYERSLVVKREIGDRRGEGNSLTNMGIAREQLGDPKLAQDMWRAALAICEEIEDPDAAKVRGWLEELNS